MSRNEYYKYREEAYREDIVNAIIQFYYYLGDTIAIEKHDDKIIINNKGELLFPREQFGKRIEACSSLLTDLLARTTYMKNAGTGIKRVKGACLEKRNKILFNFTDAVEVTIETNRNVVGNVVDKRLTIIIDILANNKHQSAAQIAERLKVSARTIQRDMEKLKKEGKL